MATLLEYVGNVHIFLGPYRGNPIALYLKRGSNGCEIAPKVYPWNDVIGKGDTPNRAAADFEEKWKTKGLSPEMYSGPAWQGIKPEKPAPPKPPEASKPTATATAPANDKVTGPDVAKPEASTHPATVSKPAALSTKSSHPTSAPTKPAPPKPEST